MRVGRTCTADDVVGTIEALVAERGAPAHLRMDNGPELVAWALGDWCRLAGTRTTYIEPGSPWQTPWVESFNGRARDELLNVEEFGSLTRPRSSSRRGGRSTTSTGRTPPWITSRRRSSGRDGSRSTKSPAPLTHPRLFKRLPGRPRGRDRTHGPLSQRVDRFPGPPSEGTHTCRDALRHDVSSAHNDRARISARAPLAGARQRRARDTGRVGAGDDRRRILRFARCRAMGHGSRGALEVRAGTGRRAADRRPTPCAVAGTRE